MSNMLVLIAAFCVLYLTRLETWTRVDYSEYYFAFDNQYYPSNKRRWGIWIYPKWVLVVCEGEYCSSNLSRYVVRYFGMSNLENHCVC